MTSTPSTHQPDDDPAVDRHDLDPADAHIPTHEEILAATPREIRLPLPDEDPR